MEFDDECSKMLTPLIGRGWFNLPKGKYIIAVYADGYSPELRVVELNKDKKEVFTLEKSREKSSKDIDDFNQLKIQILDKRSRFPVQGAFVVIDSVPEAEEVIVKGELEREVLI